MVHEGVLQDPIRRCQKKAAAEMEEEEDDEEACINLLHILISDIADDCTTSIYKYK